MHLFSSPRYVVLFLLVSDQLAQALVLEPV